MGKMQDRRMQAMAQQRDRRIRREGMMILRKRIVTRRPATDNRENESREALIVDGDPDPLRREGVA